MNNKLRVTRVFAAAIALAALLVLGPAAKAQQYVGPLIAEDFDQAAPRAFGDRQNSWAQAMSWWKGALYVGTARASLCTSLFAVHRFAVTLIGQELADTYLPYPPPDPDLECAADGADLPLQAEIWRWSPTTNWMRVFQSPLDLDNPGPGAPLPPLVGKKLPYEIAFRGMEAHTEPDGTQALYAFGVNSTVLWDRNALPPPRILRTTDGFNFTPIPQTPGTFLGDLPFNPDHSSFRSPVSFGGKLFVLSGPIFGQGSLIASADPAKGDNAWFLAAPISFVFYELAAFNGWLYLGTLSPDGYMVVKTRAEGPPPYQFVTVIPPGAYLPVGKSRSVVSMHVHDGRLFVGTASQTELIRINPDDTWDLVMGPPRLAPLPGGGTETKYPLSGLDAGFGHSLNDHAWQMDTAYGQLYVGTFNASTGAKNDPINGPKLIHNMGAHLYRSPDSWYYSAVTTNGFSDPFDPFGGKFDFGIRTMATTPYGFFLGTTNDHYGLAIFRGTPPVTSRVAPPSRLEIEKTAAGHALLSWNGTLGGVVTYEIWRAEIGIVLVRDEFNFENWNGVTGNKFPDSAIGPYERIGTVTAKMHFIDNTVQADKRYMYYATAVINGKASDQSNLVAFPLLTPAMTFARLEHELNKLKVRARYSTTAWRVTALRNAVVTAAKQAAACKLTDAVNTLKGQNPSYAVLAPDAADVKILIDKIIRRLTLKQLLPGEVVSSEFCVAP